MGTFLVFLAALLVGGRAIWAQKRGRFDPVVLIRDAVIAIATLILVVQGSAFWLNFAWWKELGQEHTYWQYVRIRWEPQSAAVILGFIVLDAAFRLGRRHSRGLEQSGVISWLGHVAALAVSLFLALNLIDPWKIALWLGSRDTGNYRDPIFQHSLAFYLFRLPFYRMIFTWIGFLLVLALALYGATLALGASGETLGALRERLEAGARGSWGAGPDIRPMLPDFSGLVRTGATLLLVLYAVNRFFTRYDLLYSRHTFLYGADFVDARIGLPLLWAQAAGALLVAAGIALWPHRKRSRFSGRWPALDALGLKPELVVAFAAIVILPPIATAVIRSAYVRPNELTLEMPYIVDHIAATRNAYGIEQNSKEEEFTPKHDRTFNLADYPDTADNIRLWDWRPFQDNITQLQALRPYYDFPDVDVDRYDINGEKREVMISARSLDTNLLPDTAQTWLNLHMQYTHGYGAVAGLVNEASDSGQPKLLLENAPPETKVARFQLKRPEIYFGEQTNSWVFVDTTQQEFDYPRGQDNAYNTYHGTAGVPIPNLMTRVAAAIAENDTNILLTDYLTPQSKLLLHRQIVRRVERLAPFLLLDPDPYLVVDRSGHLFWMLDAYTISDRHPYSEPVDVGDQEINYIRNSVKITVDAYNGTVHFYVFDDQDPVLAAYRRVFPQLFLPKSAMPKDLLDHIRYPELLFSTQAQIYRVYHMTDPRVFYNKEDLWDVARQVASQGETEYTQPYYVMMQLPGSKRAHFVLMLPFTSHHRDNLIAWIAARCDPAHYGQILFFRLPKEELIYGPLQIESLIDQNRDISKDLSLWNQQGSRVIRGTTLVLPVGNTFIYLEPIYIQATQARLPELKKVVLAVGNRLVYTDDLQEAVAELAQPEAGAAGVVSALAAPSPTAGAAPQAIQVGGTAIPASVLSSIAQHLQNYEKLTAAGRLAQAGQELEAIRQETQSALAATRAASTTGAGKRPAKPAHEPRKN